MSEVVIYHNPRCSKSRMTLELIRSHGIEPTIIEYLKQAPSAAELDKILTLLGREPRELLRSGEAEYQQAGLSDMNLSRAQIIEKMVAYPKVIERPVVVNGDRAAVGRPPESVLAILD